MNVQKKKKKKKVESIKCTCSLCLDNYICELYIKPRQHIILFYYTKKNNNNKIRKKICNIYNI
ncbi:hypothetical protein C923_04667 [Plasmodium falciparum UGT5.1]|uniref:Uncharacterized protein n=1 Tax=Plasmodium falciparum UGT5.1 TaxID=1237627 RepID=W7J6S9_PLAFA|nr:hypothetical protein C923_04667 [Plasmodium falciparum UGT5.1]